VGGLRFPARTWIAPGYTAGPAFMMESGPVNPVSGAWQTAQDWPGGVERLGSKNSALPSCSNGLSSWAAAVAMVKPNTAAVMV